PNPIDHDLLPAGENNEPFTVTYQVTDGDGDTATSTLSISIDDDTPTAGANANVVVLDDDDLAGGIASGTGDDAPAFTSGTLSHNYGADGAGTTLLTGAGLPTSSVVEGAFYQTVSLDGLTLTISQVQGGVGVSVVVVTLANATGGAYTVTHPNPIDHAAGLDENNQ